jgi:predicted MPP superfamily phosphohydrolase
MLGIGLGSGLLLALGLLGWGVLNARATPLVRSAMIGLRDWPAGAAPIKVVLMSDIHVGNIVMDPARLSKIVSQVNGLRPDLVVLAGDFVVGHNPSGIEARAAKLTGPLARLRPPLGTVAVLGNHDEWTGPRTIRTALSGAGITVLDNQAVRAGPIVIAGVGDAFSGHDQAARTLGDARRFSGPIVVLTHSPDLSPNLPADARLVLAGHTHCGQVVFPWGSPSSIRSPYAGGKRLYDPRYRCGWIHDPGRSVIVTSGVGSGTVPIRFGASPDIWLLTLGPEQASPPTSPKAP